jgi:hypothetical protein
MTYYAIKREAIMDRQQGPEWGQDWMESTPSWQIQPFVGSVPTMLFGAQYLKLKHQKPVTGEPKWILWSIIRETWKFQKNWWIAQNEKLHGSSSGKLSTGEATKQALLTWICASTTRLYKHEMDLLVQDRFPFTTEIADD